MHAAGPGLRSVLVSFLTAVRLGWSPLNQPDHATVGFKSPTPKKDTHALAQSAHGLHFNLKLDLSFLKRKQVEGRLRKSISRLGPGAATQGGQGKKTRGGKRAARSPGECAGGCQ
eukprot:5742-Pelagomonas_calceolata.AAC.1